MPLVARDCFLIKKTPRQEKQIGAWMARGQGGGPLRGLRELMAPRLGRVVNCALAAI
jgi:hypothetical protein